VPPNRTRKSTERLLGRIMLLSAESMGGLFPILQLVSLVDRAAFSVEEEAKVMKVFGTRAHRD